MSDRDCLAALVMIGRDGRDWARDCRYALPIEEELTSEEPLRAPDAELGKEMHLLLPLQFAQPLVSLRRPSEFAALGTGVELYFHQVRSSSLRGAIPDPIAVFLSRNAHLDTPPGSARDGGAMLPSSSPSQLVLGPERNRWSLALCPSPSVFLDHHRSRVPSPQLFSLATLFLVLGLTQLSTIFTNLSYWYATAALPTPYPPLACAV